MNKQLLCKNCVNFIVDEDGKEITVSCDLEYFLYVNLEKGIIFVPELFDCEQYEEVY